MSSKTNVEQSSTPSGSDDFVTVPRKALKALAEFHSLCYRMDHMRGIIPPRHSRWVSWGLHDDLLMELAEERRSFLKVILEKAYLEACGRAKAEMGSAWKPGSSPSLELFAESVVALDDPKWDTPMSLKLVRERKRTIKANTERMKTLKAKHKHLSTEFTLDFMEQSLDISIAAIKTNLDSDSPEVRAKAQGEIPRLIAKLGELAAVS